MNHVHVSTAPPAMLRDADFKALVAKNAGNAWPAATDQSIYAFFLAPATSLNMGGDACSQGIGGYHSEATVGGTHVAYAVVPSCTFGRGQSAPQQSTASMSHELDESVTDPRTNSNPAYIGFDNDHFSFDWFQSFMSENGDACELFRSSFYEDMEGSFAFYVQRTWSNMSAAAGHNPCVPAAPGPYFNVTPLNLSKVTVDTTPLGPGNSGTVSTTGVQIALGQSGTVELAYYSDAPTPTPWTLDYIEGGPINPVRTPRLTVTIDKPMGTNGDHATATVKVNARGPLKAELLTFRSTLGMDKHYMPIVISTP
jgi:hypothetical protein